ncbi:hypothetical protein AAC387_Pa10g0264 [Persea americana]
MTLLITKHVLTWTSEAFQLEFSSLQFIYSSMQVDPLAICISLNCPLRGMVYKKEEHNQRCSESMFQTVMLKHGIKL